MSYNKLKALEGNIEAISTALAIHEERRNATTAERETLFKFTGCGGIKEVLSIGTDTPIPGTMQEAVKRLLSVLSKAAKGNETLYRQLLQSLKSSVLTAFYTPTFLIQAVAEQIKDTFTANDLKMGTFLEPSAGIGGFLPVGDMATHRTAFEKDLLTGLVLSALHPDTQVFIEGFETIDSQETEHNRFDVIASNIPFGDFRVFDNTFSKKGGIYAQASKTIHNYFFLKAVEKLNEGGILAFVTSRGIADTQGNQFVRDYLVHRCNLITALRLPDSLFMQTSGIEVGSDLLIFQKSGRKVTLTDREKLFIETTREIVPGSDQYTGHTNKLFTLPKTALFTESRIQTNQYGEYVRKYRWQGEEADLQQTLSSMLKADFERFFTKKTTDYELNITGSIKRKERFRTYIKIPELATFLREITDYRTAEMINLDVPQKNVRFLSDKPTIAQEEMIGRLVSFAGSGNWDDLGLDIPQPDNLDMAKMLVATNVARKMALDMRLLGDKFADDLGNKASRCATTIYDYYVRSKSNKGTQFVFSDLSTYKSNEWNIYQDIKDKLVTMGIPANEIRFIQTAKTEQERKKLFTDMNNGTVRVLFGSTSMLGTGVNAQQRAVAVHHLEVPWRPADLEQRNGRAVRKGNTVKFWGGNVVDIIIYGTEKTLDAYKFNLLRNKQLFINQINNGTIAVRRIDEDSMDENTGMNFAEFVAVLSGNMDLLNKAKLDNRIMQLEKEQAIFNKERYRAERKIAKTEQDIEETMLTKQRMSEDWAYYKEYKGERKTLLLNLQQAIAEETGRELHKIAKTYRNESIGTIGSYIGLNLSVRSEYHYTGAFERNIFLVEGKSGLKYKCGLSGALPLGFADSAVYPQATLDKLPELIRRQQEKIDQLANELPTLQQIFSRKWGKTAELDALKQECKELQRKIDNSLKELEQQPAVTVIAA